jgi:DNA-binding IclR family transcriptional regulator/sugar lactone lactonase YvrE
MRNDENNGTLEKALDVLEAIGNAPQGLDHVQLGELVNLPRTTLYRVLGSLVARGMIRRDRARKVYRLGFRYLELVRNAYLMPDLTAAASYELRTLRDLTGETAYLAVLDGNQVLSLERCEGAHSQRSAAALGQSKPLYCTSQGKAILSVMDEAARNKALKGVSWEALTPLTLTDRRRLNAELKITAQRGYAIDDEEIVLGVRCVGAPIVDAAGQVRGALSVAGPAFRLTLDRLALIGPEVAEAARRVGAQLAPAEVRVPDGAVSAVPGQWAFHGAFPRCSAQGPLYWADTLAPSIHLADKTGDRLFCTLESPIVGMLMQPEGLLVAHQQGWVRVDDGGKTQPLEHWPGAGLQALCAHPDASQWGCVHTDPGTWQVGAVQGRPPGEPVWRFDEPVTALAWDAEGAQLFAVAPNSGTIYQMRPGAPQVRRFASLPKGSGKLSGLALDSRGGVWTALRGGWSVVCFSQDGNLEHVIGVPVPCPTDVGLSNDGASLFVTSSRDAFDAEALKTAPLSGQLFTIDLRTQA